MVTALTLAATPACAQAPQDRIVSQAEFSGDLFRTTPWWKVMLQCGIWHSSTRPKYTGTPAQPVSGEFIRAGLAQLMKDRGLTKERAMPVINAYVMGPVHTDIAQLHSFMKIATVEEGVPETESARFVDEICTELMGKFRKLT
jgi:hypothetical protein